MARFVTLPRVRVSGVCASVLFLALGLLVAQDATVGLDRRVQDVFVPEGRWNHSHQVVSSIPDLVSSPRLILGLVLVAAVLAAWRRSVRPLVVAGLLVLTSVVAVVGIKHVIARPDTGGHMGGGSFPSGHMTIVVVTVGGVLLLALPRTLWWHWVLVSPIWLAMAGCLLYGDIHWLTDIMGGVLLAWALLDVAATIPGRTGITARTSTAPAADIARQGSPRAPA